MKNKEKPVSSMLTGFFASISKRARQNLINPKNEAIFRVNFCSGVNFGVSKYNALRSLHLISNYNYTYNYKIKKLINYNDYDIIDYMLLMRSPFRECC